MSYHYKTNNVEYQMCSNCGGKGTVDHKICHGTGYVKKDTLGGWDQVKCRKCDGTGILQCSVCGGTGQVGRY